MIGSFQKNLSKPVTVPFLKKKNSREVRCLDAKNALPSLAGFRKLRTKIPQLQSELKGKKIHKEVKKLRKRRWADWFHRWKANTELLILPTKRLDWVHWQLRAWAWTPVQPYLSWHPLPPSIPPSTPPSCLSCLKTYRRLFSILKGPKNACFSSLILIKASRCHILSESSRATKNRPCCCKPEELPDPTRKKEVMSGSLAVRLTAHKTLNTTHTHTQTQVCWTCTQVMMLWAVIYIRDFLKTLMLLRKGSGRTALAPWGRAAKINRPSSMKWKQWETKRWLTRHQFVYVCDCA